MDMDLPVLSLRHHYLRPALPFFPHPVAATVCISTPDPARGRRRIRLQGDKPRRPPTSPYGGAARVSSSPRRSPKSPTPDATLPASGRRFLHPQLFVRRGSLRPRPLPIPAQQADDSHLLPRRQYKAGL
ncbi:unnamed protein product [Urochloa humidicola]